MASTAPGSSAVDRVTIWTSVGYLEKEGSSKAKAEMRYYFESQVFYDVTALQMPEYLQTRLRASEEANVPLIIILCTEGNPIWFSSSLATGFPTLKSDWSKEFLNSHTFRFMAENGTVLLPIIRRDVRSLTFFLQYPVIERQTLPKKIQANGEDQVEVKLCPVATWIGSSSDFSDPMNSGIPVIGIVCRDERIVKILQDQCVSGNWSISQLSGCPGRIFVDLFIMLSQWSKVWRWARHELAVRDAQLHGEKASMDILTQTRALHRHTANVIAMREELRLHIAAFGKLLVLLNAPENRSLKELFGKEHEARELYEKLEECWVNLSHHQESSAVIIRQLENLLSLAFNTETVSQGLAVARLNTLAFGFLPLSWVATLFGMTNFSLSAIWYPLWAFVVICVLLLAFYLPKVLSKWHKAHANFPPRIFLSKTKSNKRLPTSSASLKLPPGVMLPRTFRDQGTSNAVTNPKNESQATAVPSVPTMSVAKPDNMDFLSLGRSRPSGEMA